MAYVPNNLSLTTQDLGNQGSARWILRGVDTSTTVRGNGFITDAADKGLKVNDIVEYTDTVLGIVSDLKVVAINTNGSADLGDATVIGLATNT